MEGYCVMSVLVEDEGLSKLDGNNGLVDYWRVCCLFVNNCGFIIVEFLQFFMVCSDEFVMELGVIVYGVVFFVYVYVDGIKWFIFVLGVGNYLIVGQVLNDL